MFTTLGKLRAERIQSGQWMEIAGVKCRIIRLWKNEDLTVSMYLAYYDDTLNHTIELKVYGIQEFEVFESK